MTCATTVAHRAAIHLRRAVPLIVALALAVTATVAVALPAAAAYAPKVVIVVGPSGSSTGKYLQRAEQYASKARAYGASVIRVYTPHATWSRVLAAAQGANVFIYLGHGNGWPSPYPPFQTRTKDGLGLNPSDGSGNTTTKYYGEAAVAAQIRFAPSAVVLLNHLCYASGNGEPGSAEPSWATARKRVDNFAAGFLRAGASAVLADAHSSLSNEIAYLFGRRQGILAAWRADPDARGHERSFPSVRTPGYTTWLDPDKAKAGFYRSLVTTSAVPTTTVRTAPFSGSLKVGGVLRGTPATNGTQIQVLAGGSRIWVTRSPVTDGAGRTWAPVITTAGRRGFVAAWLAGFTGSARTVTNVILRTGPRTTAGRILTVKHGVRVAVLKSAKDSKNRLWLNVKLPSGKAGWLAGWLVTP